MIRMTPELKDAFAKMARQYPEFGEFLDTWRQEELEKLPYGVATNLDVLRGRVQSLTELRQALFGRE